MKEKDAIAYMLLQTFHSTVKYFRDFFDIKGGISIDKSNEKRLKRNFDFGATHLNDTEIPDWIS